LPGLEAQITAQLLIATIQQTILRRDKMPEADYLPYFMYIDEFQTYADTNEKTITEMTERLRKYHFGLTLTSLVASHRVAPLLDVGVGVVRTIICLAVSAKAAGYFARELLIREDKRDSLNNDPLKPLNGGQAYAQTPPYKAGVCVQLPQEP